jgi:crotonyl-CoA carboxylase/reductase
MGLDPVLSSTASVWGYEDNYGCFAQFSVVEEFQCYAKPPKLTFEEAACCLANAATSYRQLMGWPPHTVKPGAPVLIWGGAGGLGSVAIQIARHFGGLPVAVVSDAEKHDFCMSIGAAGTINRRDFSHWGRMPEVEDRDGVDRWMRSARDFGKQIWEAVGTRRNPAIVFEHSGKDTLPTSIFVCDAGGMVVLCGATSGYHVDLDLRYMWMRMKRLQGSHFATPAQFAEVNQLMHTGAIRPPLARTYAFADIAEPHQLMYENRHPSGNMSVLVNAPGEGLRDIAL